MPRRTLIVAALFAIAVSAALNSEPNPWRTVENWAKLPKGMHFGQVIQVQPDIDGKSIWVFHRASPHILKFDENGNLTHQAVYRASGRADLDAAALSAVRKAAPFPPPPPGDPRAIWFHYATR